MIIQLFFNNKQVIEYAEVWINWNDIKIRC